MTNATSFGFQTEMSWSAPIKQVVIRGFEFRSKMNNTPSDKVFLTNIDHWRCLEVVDEEANSFPLVSK